MFRSRAWPRQTIGLANAAGQMAGASFILPLNDAGAGVVSTTPYVSTASATATFTRATTAYTRLSNGLYGLVSSGQPRSYYSATGVYLGYLSEGARSNLIGGTTALVRDMSSASWVATNITKGTTTGIDGTAAAAATLTASAGNGTILYTPGLGSAERTYSFWAKRITGSGTIQITEDGSTFTTITVTDTVNWTQYQIDSGSIVPVVGFKIVTSGDAIAVDFNMLEAATFANPTPIPVNVNKAADILTYVSGITTLPLTAYAEISATPAVPNADQHFLAVDDNSLTNRCVMYHSSASPYGLGSFLAPGSINPIADSAAGLNASISKCATIFTATSAQNFLNGVAGTQKTGASTATGFSVIRISGRSDGTFNYFGAVKNIVIWPTEFQSTTAQAMTT